MFEIIMFYYPNIWHLTCYYCKWEGELMLREQVKKVLDRTLLKHVLQFFEELTNNDVASLNLALQDHPFAFFVEENKKIVAGILGHGIASLDKKLKNILAIERLAQTMGDHLLVVTTKLNPSYESPHLTNLLFLRLAEDCMQKGISHLFYLSDLNHCKILFKLGFRQYKNNVISPCGKLTIPLVLCLKDYNYLKKISSPLITTNLKIFSDEGQSSHMISLLFNHFHNNLTGDEINLRAQTKNFIESRMGGMGHQETEKKIKLLLTRGLTLRLFEGDNFSLINENKIDAGIILHGQIIETPHGNQTHNLEETCLGPGASIGGPSTPARYYSFKNSEVLFFSERWFDSMIPLLSVYPVGAEPIEVFRWNNLCTLRFSKAP